ncbi:oxidoreductase [Endozoicomonas sp. OPT23]|uniref:SDR family NAD(P)-dependent oxidoreductase n=1 Tax=Endozoicomonas sp. OPT23 TaxID=2072845 RepID=UPI00129A5F67|nr:SDR family NAD(P)-dependent oxidoreductase [Endozoicomonas sp. OPT23]MRI33896.1 oxidoreductase [Endozoicomonas sp. OPT23]
MNKNDFQEFPEGVALVVGGSGGTGAVISQRLVEMGATVALTYNSNKTRADEMVAQITADGGSAEAFQLNMKDLDTVITLFDQLKKKHGQVHTVVMATGYDIPQEHISEISPELWQDVINTDLNGFYNVAHTAIPYLRESKGSIVHISSAGLGRFPARDVLSVSPKAAIDSLVKGIAKEEGPHGIRANSVAIGVIETGIFLRLRAEGVFDDNWVEAVTNGLCVQRFGKPEEVADTACFLASNRAKYVTGQTIFVDGGYHV